MNKFFKWIESIFKHEHKKPEPVKPAPVIPKPAPVKVEPVITEPAKPEPAKPIEIEEPVWVKWFRDRLGWTEFDHDKELSKGWKWTHLNYTSVIGSDRAWCSMAVCTALEVNGYKSSGSAAASSYANFGTKCEAKLGAIVPIVHTSGKHHVTIFLSWKDKKNKIALCLGGNQSNKVCIAEYNLSGNDNGHDEVMNGFRWPTVMKD